MDIAGLGLHLILINLPRVTAAEAVESLLDLARRTVTAAAVVEPLKDASRRVTRKRLKERNGLREQRDSKQELRFERQFFKARNNNNTTKIVCMRYLSSWREL